MVLAHAARRGADGRHARRRAAPARLRQREVRSSPLPAKVPAGGGA
eukprot:gene45065-34321_t